MVSLLQQAVERLGPDAALHLLSPEERAAAAYIWPLVARPSRNYYRRARLGCLHGDYYWKPRLRERRRMGSQKPSAGCKSETCPRMALNRGNRLPTLRDYHGFEGESGLAWLTVSPPWNGGLVYEPSPNAASLGPTVHWPQPISVSA